MKKPVLALSLLAAASAAQAQGSGFYLGASAGQSDTRFKTEDFSAGTPLFSESKNRHDTAWKLFAGYAITPNLAVEAGYTDFGRPEYRYAGNDLFTGISGDVKVRESAWFAAAKGTVPINEQFAVFARLGVTRNYLKASARTNIPDFTDLGSRSKERTDAVLGAGVEFMPMRNVGIRAEYENYGRFGDASGTGRTRVDLWSVGVVLKF